MANDKNQIVPINSNILTGISVDELEDRLEMQLLGLLDVISLASAETTNCPSVKVKTRD